MSTGRQPTLLRATAVGCLLFLLLWLQIAVLYTFMNLFQRTYVGSLPGFVPWLVLGGFTSVLVVLAGRAVVRGQPAEMVLGGGLLLFAATPLVSNYVQGGGCAGGGRTGNVVPHLTWREGGLLLQTANKGCDAYLNGPLLALAVVMLAVGLWRTTIIDSVVSTLLTGVESRWPTLGN